MAGVRASGRRRRPGARACACACAAAALAVVGRAVAARAEEDAAATTQLLSRLSAPTGFAVSAFTQRGALPNARSLALSVQPTGALLLYVSTRQGSSVYAAVDADADGRSEEHRTVVNDKPTPCGIAARGGDLYVAQIDSVWHYASADAQVLGGEGLLAAPRLVTAALPSDPWHGWKYVTFAPSGHLLLQVGAPCNVCDPAPFVDGGAEVAWSTIYALDVDSGELVGPVATGVRNTVGLTFHPDTGDLFFTDNGRDMMGDNLPDCELNRLPAARLEAVLNGSAVASFYGFPFCHTDGGPLGDPYLREAGGGARVPDPSLNEDGAKGDCDDDAFAGVRAIQALGPHTAPLGLRIYTATGSPSSFPAEYDRSALVALHGSWNRRDFIGYNVVAVHLSADGKESLGQSVLLEGCLGADQTRYCRPVDTQQLPDGSVLVSDDQTGTVLRVAYVAGTPEEPAPPTDEQVPSAPEPDTGDDEDERQQPPADEVSAAASGTVSPKLLTVAVAAVVACSFGMLE